MLAVRSGRPQNRRSYRAGLPPALLLLTCLCAALPLKAAPPPDSGAEAPDTKGVVEIETEGSAGGSVRVAEDLASIVDDGATRRVLPVVGKSAQQNVIDLARLHGIDLAVLQVDVVESMRQQGTFSYITQLYNQEFHLLARPEIKTLADLANQKVNVDQRGTGTGLTAARLFSLLKVATVPTNYDQGTALDKLRKGEIAALAFVAGKPAPLFQTVKPEEGLHFLAIPVDTAVINTYVPSSLTASDYPNLVPQSQRVDTVAVGTVLAVANFPTSSPRYHNVANFVDVFFTGFPSLLQPGHHPKWHDINLAAVLPGWNRFPPAQQWLDRNANVATRQNEEDLKTQFSRFIDTRQRVIGGTAMTPQQKQQLFDQFEHWRSGQAR